MQKASEDSKGMPSMNILNTENKLLELLGKSDKNQESKILNICPYIIEEKKLKRVFIYKSRGKKE